jgi:hypothetical protein
MKYLAIPLLFLSSLANADNLVLACPYVWGSATYCGGCSGPTWVKPAKGLTVRPHVLDRWTNIDTLKPDDLVSVSSTAPEGSLGQCSQITGSKKVSELLGAPVLPPAPTWSYSDYKCEPKSWGEIRTDIRIFEDRGIGAWYCDTPTAIIRQHYCGKPSNAPKLLMTLAFDRIVGAAKARPPRACEADELELVDPLHLSEGVKITVATNGTSATRPIYSATATNRLGTPTGARATVNAPCGY